MYQRQFGRMNRKVIVRFETMRNDRCLSMVGLKTRLSGVLVRYKKIISLPDSFANDTLLTLRYNTRPVFVPREPIYLVFTTAYPS